MLKGGAPGGAQGEGGDLVVEIVLAKNKLEEPKEKVATKLPPTSLPRPKPDERRRALGGVWGFL